MYYIMIETGDNIIKTRHKNEMRYTDKFIEYLSKFCKNPDIVSAYDMKLYVVEIFIDEILLYDSDKYVLRSMDENTMIYDAKNHWIIFNFEERMMYVGS